MNRKHDEVAQQIGRVPYKVVRAANGDVQVDVRGKKYSDVRPDLSNVSVESTGLAPIVTPAGASDA